MNVSYLVLALAALVGSSTACQCEGPEPTDRDLLCLADFVLKVSLKSSLYYKYNYVPNQGYIREDVWGYDVAIAGRRDVFKAPADWRVSDLSRIYTSVECPMDLGYAYEQEYYISGFIIDGKPYMDFCKSLARRDEPSNMRLNPLLALLNQLKKDKLNCN